MRGFRLIVPPDCIGSQVNRERQSAVRRMVRLLGAQATPSPKVGLEAGIEPAKDEGPMKTPDLP